MSVFEQRFYTLNRSLLSSVGLWPFVDRKEKLLRGFFVQIGLYVGTFIQTMRLIISRYNSDLVLEFLSYVIAFIVVTTTYSVIYFDKRINQVQLFEGMVNDWRKAEDAKEYEILKKFAEQTWSILITLIVVTCLHVLLIVPFSTYPLVLDIINPLNKTRQTKFIPLLEYFSGQEKQILKILPIYYLSILLLGAVISATIGLLMTCVQHACSMFALTGYLLKNASNEQSTRCVNDGNNKTYARIVRAMQCHKRALDFLDQINSFVETPSLFIYTLMLAFITFEISQINKIDVKRMSVMVVQFLVITIISINGQKIIDLSGSVFESAIMAQWYVLPVRTQKLFLLIMMRSIRPSCLSIGGLFATSNEFSLSLIKCSLSYGMVLYSLQ